MPLLFLCRFVIYFDIIEIYEQVKFKSKTSALSCIFAIKMQIRALKSVFSLSCANYKQVTNQVKRE